eukprot:6331117-Prymnesium_polylepis.1
MHFRSLSPETRPLSLTTPPWFSCSEMRSVFRVPSPQASSRFAFRVSRSVFQALRQTRVPRSAFRRPP